MGVLAGADFDNSGRARALAEYIDGFEGRSANFNELQLSVGSDRDLCGHQREHREGKKDGRKASEDH